MDSTVKYSFIWNDSFVVFEDGRIFKRLDPPVSSGGYKFVRIGDKSHPLHRVIASAFIPNPENKPEVNHIDGNKANNAVSNLEWVTRTENMKHAKENGLCKGRKSKNRPLARNKIRERRKRNGISQRDLANRLGISQASVAQWETGKTMPTLANLIQIAETLHVSINDLVDDD